MSAAAHESAAAVASSEAAEHAVRFDPTQTRLRVTGCVRAPCSPEEVNPTAVHRQEAADLEAAAAQHRKAAEELRAAEARACADVTPNTGGDLSPFFQARPVDRVEPLYSYAGVRSRVLIGAKVVLAAAPGVSASSVQKSLDCHLARNAAMGFDAPEMSFCPLAAKGVEARAREKNGLIVVEVKAAKAETAEQVLRRAELTVVRR